MSLEVEEVLFEAKSQYQHIFVFKSKTWGNVLVLDGVIQLTERDEMAYQEMITHLPLYSHPNPQDVLIIGGGDGGVIREIVKHSGVKSITICEIDRVVIEAGKKYFPSVAAAWDDSRVKLYEGDGAVFMQKPENLDKYDVIITDSSDPVGPAASLFETPFYQSMYGALKAGGKICTQAESMWINLNLIKRLMKDALAIFANAEYASTQIPTYPAGQIGFLLCSKSDNKSRQTSRTRAAVSCARPARDVKANERENYKFYTSELHVASFVLPAFVQRAVDEARAEAEELKKAAEPTGSAKKKQTSSGKKSKRDSESVSTTAATGTTEKEAEEEDTTKKQKTVEETQSTSA
jgi:spermidine synthase